MDALYRIISPMILCRRPNLLGHNYTLEAPNTYLSLPWRNLYWPT